MISARLPSRRIPDLRALREFQAVILVDGREG